MPRDLRAAAQRRAIYWIPLCAAGFYFCATSRVAFQDTAGLVSDRVDAARRWTAHLIHAPDAADGMALKLVDTESAPIGIERVAVRKAESGEADGAQVNRSRKGDLLASRIRPARGDMPSAGTLLPPDYLLSPRSDVGNVQTAFIKPDRIQLADVVGPTMTLRRLTTTPVLAYAPADGQTGPLPSAGLLAKPLEVAIPLPSRKGVPPSQTVDDPGRALAMREALAASGDIERSRQCLAEAIYFEARSESEEGQVAVAQVILNRTRSHIYPSNVCDVVYQNADWYNRCQFSFACDRAARRRPNPADRVRDPEAWAKAVEIADQVGNGERWLPWVGNATHYHADYVRPRWRRNMVQLSRIGRHVFYRLRNITRDLLKLPPKDEPKDADRATDSADDESGTEL